MSWRSILLAGVGVALLAIPSSSQQAPAPLSARHIHIRVMDVERTKSFYRDKLGLKVINERPGEVVEFEGLWFGKWRGSGPIPTGGITIGLHAASVEATYNTLKQRGVDLPKPPAPMRNEFAFSFKDPDGYEVEIEGPK